jgi:LPS-assembly lipoprotein
MSSSENARFSARPRAVSARRHVAGTRRATPTTLARAAAAVAVLAVTLLAGCGFHLRGEAKYDFTSIFVASPPGLPFTSELLRSVEGAGGVQMTAAADQAQVVLEVNSVTEDKEVLSLSGGGKVREFLLSTRVLFRVHDRVGNDWLPTSEVLIRRSYTYNDTEALAKEAQEQRLRREMQSDAVQQIVRRLEAAHKPA